MSDHIAGMKITQRGDDIRLSLDFSVPPSQWPEEAIDRLMGDICEVQEDDLVQALMVQALLDENTELRRDGDSAIQDEREKKWFWRVACWVMLMLAFSGWGHVWGWW